MTAAARAAYTAAHNDSIKLLDQIKEQVILRDRKLENSDIHWPQAGDMAHVAGKLAEILEFLKS